jgi:hypothetical protein
MNLIILNMHVSFYFIVLSPRFKMIAEMELVQKRKNEQRREKGQMIMTKKK